MGERRLYVTQGLCLTKSDTLPVLVYLCGRGIKETEADDLQNTQILYYALKLFTQISRHIAV
jgi:hypothetical protein